MEIVALFENSLVRVFNHESKSEKNRANFKKFKPKNFIIEVSKQLTIFLFFFFNKSIKKKKKTNKMHI